MLAFCLLDDVANKEFFSNFFLLYTKDSVHICICKYHVSFSLRLLFVQSFEASYGFWLFIRTELEDRRLVTGQNR